MRSGILITGIIYACIFTIYNICNIFIYKMQQPHNLMPTQKQSDTAIFLCLLLSNLYQSIQVYNYFQKKLCKSL
ncbi:DUF6888 family protein [Nostoc sp.]|uniref:DUF6888 family protein n=1 Tax=Nostoc sp. TaxID=1180 RepID=UPI003FA5A805